MGGKEEGEAEEEKDAEAVAGMLAALDLCVGGRERRQMAYV